MWSPSESTINTESISQTGIFMHTSNSQIYGDAINIEKSFEHH